MARLLLAAVAAVAAVLLAAPPPVQAHRPLLTGPVGGAPFSTYETALPVPWVTSSWSVKRFVECDAPLFWMKFTAERANQDVHLTAGVPAVPGLAGLRPALALFGPGLPAYDASKLNFPAPPAKPGFGMLRVSSPQDQSNCKFLENAVSKRFYVPTNFSAVGTRCAYFEPFTKSYLWVTADRNVTLPIKGATYYLASFLDGRKSTGRYTVALADWGEDEDFKRPYTPLPGNRAAADYGGAAAAGCCAAAKGQAPAPAPGGDVSKCPPFAGFGACAPNRERAAAGPPQDVRVESPETAQKLLKAGWRYLDVQTPEEFSELSAEGATNVPLALAGPSGREPNPKFLEDVDKLFPPCTKLVVGCRTGRRSYAAAQLLQGRFADIVSLDGGILAWQAAGLPLRKAARRH